jgi:hypothetical protein
MAKLAAARDLRKYDPDEPRVPAGNPDGGQWTSEGGDGDAADAAIIPDGQQFAEDMSVQSDARETATAIRAHVDTGKNVVIEYQDGSTEIRSGGSRQWRNNNPGAMWYGPFTRAQGAIGQDGRFAIFPDADIGYQAIIARLSSSEWTNFTLGNAIILNWAPKDENDSAAYAAFVEQKSGILLTRRLGGLTPEDIDNVARAIKLREGWTPGIIR